jgi:hypothetical protein
MRVPSSRVQTTPTTQTVLTSTSTTTATLSSTPSSLSVASPAQTAHTTKDGVDAVVVAGNANSANRSSGAGLTQKLVDPKRAVALDATVGQLLAFTPEELAFARTHPVVISADHNGAPLAAKLTAFLKAQGIPVTDVAALSALDRVDGTVRRRFRALQRTALFCLSASRKDTGSAVDVRG